MWNRFDRERDLLDQFDTPRYVYHDGMTDREEIAQALLAVAEKNKAAPKSVAKARCFAFYLTRVSIVFNPYSWFGFSLAGWEPARRVPYSRLMDKVRDQWAKEASDPAEEASFDKLRRSGVYAGWQDYDHSVPDWKSIMTLGVGGLRSRAAFFRLQKELDGTLTEAGAAYYEGIDIAYEAIQQFIARCCLCVESNLSRDARMPLVLRCLQTLRDGPPRTLYETLMLAYLFHFLCEFIDCVQVRSLGNMDEVYRAAYEQDLENGTLTREQAKELFKFFFAQFACEANPYGQPATLGGSFINGESSVNDLSYLMLEAYDESNILTPKLQILVAPNTPDAFVKKALDMVRRGHSSIVFLNEELGYEIYRNKGVKELDRVRICTSGCYNFALNGALSNEPAHCRINLAKGIELIFTQGRDRRTGEMVGAATPPLAQLSTYELFWQAYLAQVDAFIEEAVRLSEYSDARGGVINPTNVYSATSLSSLQKAADMFMTGAVYNDTTIITSCGVTVIDSLAMVKKYVFDRGEITLEALAGALREDWAGHEPLRQRILADHDKWGNNVQWVDEIGVALFEYIAGKINTRRNIRGGYYITCADTIDYYIRFAPMTGATPDGRRSAEPLAKGLVAQAGQDRQGITAQIGSVVKLPSAAMQLGAPFDFMLHPSAVRGEDGLAAMLGLLRAFMSEGGYSFMGNVFQPDTLRRAQEDPERYSTLQVRLCGWNVYFTNLSREHQDYLIKAAEEAV